jgi:elongation factor Ts
MTRKIVTYNHDGRIGVIVEMSCKDDWTSRTDEFKALGRDIAMQIAATNPKVISPRNSAEVIPIETRDSNQESHEDPEALLSQPFVKEPEKTVGEYLNEVAGSLGDRIDIVRFVRYETDET